MFADCIVLYVVYHSMFGMLADGVVPVMMHHLYAKMDASCACLRFAETQVSL